MITVNHLEHSRSQRILWLLEELGVDYEIKQYNRDPETRLAPPDLRDVHPLGKSTWFCGDRLTAADIQMSFAVEAAEVRANMSSYPNIAGFRERMRSRPGYRRAIERGGPYELMRATRS